tara:strand:+ start:2969 stop:3580 length:612 start_codon:yes stop_codon:yes gene_type:complete
MKKIAIIDYGAGNTASLINAIEYLNFQPVILKEPNEQSFSHIILPGVGAFGKLSENLKKFGFDEFLSENKKKGNFILGICIGMQLLFKSSDEGKSQNGLGFINGNFELFNIKDFKLPIPHVGFNRVEHKNSMIWNNIKNNSSFYFIHSYRIKKIEDNCEIATSKYGEEFICYVEKDNIFGSQFHPEKSHKNGLQFLNNFLNLN